MCKKKIWLTWENHRRSRELASSFGARLCIFENESNRAFRYLILSIKTLKVLFQVNPAIVFVQNPSIVLTTLICFLRKFCSYKLIVDRHSNFKLETLNNNAPKWILFHTLSRYTIKKADLTIVTNDYLKNLVESCGGTGFILQDKIPNIKEKGESNIIKKNRKNVVFITTFNKDEPIEEIIKAAHALQEKKEIIFFLTGNYSRYDKNYNLVNRIPKNIYLTSFIPEDDYNALIRSADVVVVLTTKEFLLTCGAYEAIALRKPLVLSDTRTLRQYFNKGVVYTKNDFRAIAATVEYAIANIKPLSRDIDVLRKDLEINWNKRFKRLNNTIQVLSFS
jgi:glycosyltransferase involved in cell wall biosynthesis